MDSRMNKIFRICLGSLLALVIILTADAQSEAQKTFHDGALHEKRCASS